MARTQEKTKPKKQQAKQKPNSGSRKPSAKRDSQRGGKSGKSKNAIVRYFQETRDELRKVAWPTQEQTFRLTLIVLGTTLAFSVVLGTLDWLFLWLESLLL